MSEPLTDELAVSCPRCPSCVAFRMVRGVLRCEICLKAARLASPVAQEAAGEREWDEGRLVAALQDEQIEFRYVEAEAGTIAAIQDERDAEDMVPFAKRVLRAILAAASPVVEAAATEGGQG